MPLTPRRAFLAAPLALAGPRARAAAPLAVAVSFTVLADIVRQVGGARVRVTSLAGPDQDLHTYAPRPSDIAAIAAADLFVVNGLGAEGWADRLGDTLRRPPVIATAGIAPRRLGHETDPHAWQDVRNAEQYTRNVAAALVAADPAGAAAYRSNETAYLARLAALDADVRAAYAPIPRARRRVVTTHDALAYYGAAYGIDFLAPQGLSTDEEPSARHLAGLIAQVRGEHITALFFENPGPHALLDQIARETGARIGGRLYADALSPPDGPAPTYEAMIRYNTRQIAAALA